MRHSLRQGAGYLTIDHRDSPGLTPADVARSPGAIAVAGGTLLERDVLTCSHCQRAVVLEPLRTRDRGHCPKCDRYVCDPCEAIRAKSGACVPMTQTLDRMQALAAHGQIVRHDELPAPPVKFQIPERVAWIGERISQGKAAYAEQDWDEAEPYFRELHEEGINTSATAAALATISLNQGKRAEALRYERLVVELDPTAQDARDNLVMYLDADPATTPGDALAARQEWWNVCGASAYAQRQPLANNRNPDRVLRVGYVSGDFCHHSAATVFGPFALNHSAAFEVYFYSSTEKPDEITPIFSERSGWRDIFGKSDEAVAEQIRQDRIDILVDLSGYTANNRLKVFARKVAPVQITGWGYGTGLGWPTGVMDYLVADPIIVPPQHEEITEQIACLPCALPYTPSDRYPPTPTPLPCLEQPPTFGVFQRTLKINDASVAVWRQILEQAPDARLIIKGDYCRSFVERMQDILRPVLDRVAILNIQTSKAEHLAMWRHIDVALDTWPQSGGVVSCEALWHGVPIVTLRGDRIMSRVASSLLTIVGLSEFIAQTPEQYVEIAISAIRNRERLAHIRASLSATYADWIARTNYLQHVEEFYRSAWRASCAGSFGTSSDDTETRRASERGRVR